VTGARPRIGVAVCGGGFRATAFGLGCFRALHDAGLLASVSVISGISGGSLLTVLYAYGPGNFGEFDRATADLLRGGLQAALIRRALARGALTRQVIAAGAYYCRSGPGISRVFGPPTARTLSETNSPTGRSATAR
jgi:predicted acylesterase/phospholipase RssA